MFRVYCRVSKRTHLMHFLGPGSDRLVIKSSAQPRPAAWPSHPPQPRPPPAPTHLRVRAGSCGAGGCACARARADVSAHVHAHARARACAWFCAIGDLRPSPTRRAAPPRGAGLRRRPRRDPACPRDANNNGMYSWTRRAAAARAHERAETAALPTMRRPRRFSTHGASVMLVGSRPFNR